jgi:hypothetical protein
MEQLVELFTGLRAGGRRLHVLRREHRNRVPNKRSPVNSFELKKIHKTRTSEAFLQPPKPRPNTLFRVLSQRSSTTQTHPNTLFLVRHRARPNHKACLPPTNYPQNLVPLTPGSPYNPGSPPNI